jgi:hypothetical protein
VTSPAEFSISMSVGVLADGFDGVKLRLVKFAVPKFANGGCGPGETDVISSIHSAEFAGWPFDPPYWKVWVKFWADVTSLMDIVHVPGVEGVPGVTWKISAVI